MSNMHYALLHYYFIILKIPVYKSIVTNIVIRTHQFIGRHLNFSYHVNEKLFPCRKGLFTYYAHITSFFAHIIGIVYI